MNSSKNHSIFTSKRVSLLLAASLAFSSAGAQVLHYSETFNTTSGNNPLQNVDWLSNRSAGASAYDVSSSDILVSPIIGELASGGGDDSGNGSSNGYLFHLEALNAGQPTIWWTEALVPVDISLLDSFQADLRNANTSENLRFTFRVGASDWFVADTSVNNSTANVWSDNLTLDVGSTSWSTLDFTPGTELALGAPVILPVVGDVTAVGLFTSSKSNNSIRVDNFEVYAIPEPSSMGLIGIGMTALVIGLRRKRG
ncbi:MAG: PEP-CTERM sorting domain-containing protein [Puniceicoccaceae bacterium]